MPSVYLPMAKGIRCPKNVTLKKNHVSIWLYFALPIREPQTKPRQKLMFVKETK